MRRKLFETLVAVGAFLAAMPETHGNFTISLDTGGPDSLGISDNGLGDTSPIPGVISWSGSVGSWSGEVVATLGGTSQFPELTISADFSSAAQTFSGIVLIASGDGLQVPMEPRPILTSRLEGATAGRLLVDPEFNGEWDIVGAGFGVGPGEFNASSFGSPADPFEGHRPSAQWSLLDVYFLIEHPGENSEEQTSFTYNLERVPEGGSMLLLFSLAAGTVFMIASWQKLTAPRDFRARDFNNKRKRTKWNVIRIPAFRLTTLFVLIWLGPRVLANYIIEEDETLVTDIPGTIITPAPINAVFPDPNLHAFSITIPLSAGHPDIPELAPVPYLPYPLPFGGGRIVLISEPESQWDFNIFEQIGDQESLWVSDDTASNFTGRGRDALDMYPKPNPQYIDWVSSDGERTKLLLADANVPDSGSGAMLLGLSLVAIGLIGRAGLTESQKAGGVL
jgi:hypothetical protein